MGNKLKLFRITSQLTNLDKVLVKFVNINDIYPVKAEIFTKQVKGLYLLDNNNPFNLILDEFNEIEKDGNYNISPVEMNSIDYTYETISEYVHTTHDKLHELSQTKKEMEELIKKYNDALVIVKNINTLDISLSDLFASEYIKPKFGKLAKDSLDMLKLYENKPFIFQSFNEEKNYYWCMYLTTKKHEKEIDNIFSSLFFEKIFIPDYIQGRPEEDQKSLLLEIDTVNKELNEIENKIKKILIENKNELSKIKGELIFLQKIYSARKYVVKYGERFSITGFISAKDLADFKLVFKPIKDIEIELMPADFDKRIKPPKRIKKRK